MPQIERVVFTLSERQPLVAAVNTHARSDAFLFDMHYELELGVVLSGVMRRKYEGSTRDYHPGEAWTCGIWEPHGYRIVEAPCKALVLVIQPQMLVQTHFDEAPGFRWLAPFTSAPGKRPQVEPQRRKELLDLARRFEDSFAYEPERRALWQRLLLMEILLLLKEDKRAANGDYAPASSYGRINKAVQLVFSSREMVTSSTAARACGFSRNHFDKLFQRLMGLSFARFALRYRLSSAAAQLLRGDDPVKTVAAEWGFTDASHLHHCFMQHYGCSPAAYRKRPVPELSTLAPSGTPVVLNADGSSAPSRVAWNVPKG